MVTSMEDFSNYFFIPLIILGSWCLFEGEHKTNYIQAIVGSTGEFKTIDPVQIKTFPTFLLLVK